MSINGIMVRVADEDRGGRGQLGTHDSHGRLVVGSSLPDKYPTSDSNSLPTRLLMRCPINGSRIRMVRRVQDYCPIKAIVLGP